MYESIDRPIDEEGIYIIHYQAFCHPFYSNSIKIVVHYSKSLLPRISRVSDDYSSITLSFPRNVTGIPHKSSIAKKDYIDVVLPRDWNDNDGDEESDELISQDGSLGLDSFKIWIHTHQNTKKPVIVKGIFQPSPHVAVIHIVPLQNWTDQDLLHIAMNPNACFEMNFPYDSCAEDVLYIPLAPPITFTAQVIDSSKFLEVEVVFSRPVLSLVKSNQIEFDDEEFEDDEDNLNANGSLNTGYSFSNLPMKEITSDAFIISHKSTILNYNLSIVSMRRNWESKLDSFILSIDVYMYELGQTDVIKVDIKPHLIIGADYPRILVQPQFVQISITQGNSFLYIYICRILLFSKDGQLIVLYTPRMHCFQV